MQTAVPASCCAKMRVADKAFKMCDDGWRFLRSEEAVALRCDCFLWRSASSGGLRPGSLDPPERVWIDSSDTDGASEGLKVTGNEVGVSGAIVEGVVRVDRKSRLLHDILVKSLSCMLTEKYTTCPVSNARKVRP
jgi:hypothetical protein